MQLDEAREIAAEHGLEEGAQYHWHAGLEAEGEIAATVTITEVKRSGAGIQDVYADYDTGEKSVEKFKSIREIAGDFEIGYLTMVEDEDDEDTESDVEEEAADEDKELVTDGGTVADDDGYTLDDYPDRPDGEERLVGLNEWGAWAYEPVHNRLRNYKREDAPGRMPLEETHGAEKTLEGEDLAERIVGLDAITKHGYQLIYEHGGTDAVVNALIRADLSPGQAWAIYGVYIRGNSRNAWAKECGYSDHSAVSEAVRKGLRKLPANWYDE